MDGRHGAAAGLHHNLPGKAEGSEPFVHQVNLAVRRISPRQPEGPHHGENVLLIAHRLGFRLLSRLKSPLVPAQPHLLNIADAGVAVLGAGLHQILQKLRRHVKLPVQVGEHVAVRGRKRPV